MRCAIYARSTTTHAGCETQLRELRGYVQRRHWVLVEEYIHTAWRVGKRPQLVLLLADMRTRQKS